MSSSGINAINSGPLNIRTYNNSSNNNTYILGNYDIPVASNLILITSTNGVLAPSNNIYVSSIAVSSLVASTIDVKYAKISTLVAADATISKSYLSTVSSIGEDITFTAPVIFDTLLTAPLAHLSTVSSIGEGVTFTAPLIAPVTHFSTISSIGDGVTFTAPLIAPVTHFSTISSIGDGVTFTTPVVLTEPGANTVITSANLTIWGRPSGEPITENFTTTATYTINSTISTIDFQLVGAGGNSTFSNPTISTEQLPGYGAYISGTLRVKQGDSLVFTVGQLSSGSSGGTSLIYISTTGGVPVSTLVCIAGAGGGNGYSPDNISTSSGGGQGGGSNGSIAIGGLTDYIAIGTLGYDGFSTINGILQSVVDGGQGGQLTFGGLGGAGNPPFGGTNGANGENRLPFGTFTNGGIVSGGQGGQDGPAKGAYGGSGYNGGGGGGTLISNDNISTSGGGGGGATYIATSTLSAYLLNVVCLGGEFLKDNIVSPFGGNYGLPIHPGFANISAYSPNDTLYTNGDIECRVLKYSQLDPPINAIGGVASLWSLYPAINFVNMNNNAINECGGLEISENGMDVTGPTIISGQSFVYSSMDSTSPSTFRIELGTSANLLTYKSTISSSDATFVQNTGGGRLVLGTSDPAIYINGSTQGNNNVGIGTATPSKELTVNGEVLITNNSNAALRLFTLGVNSYIQVASTTTTGAGGNLFFTNYNNALNTMTIDTINQCVGIQTTNPSYDLDVFGTTRISSLLISSISTLQPQITISANNVSTVGNASITGNLTVNSTLYLGALSTHNISSGTGLFGTLSSSTYIRGVDTSAISNNTSFPLITNYNGTVGININKGSSDSEIGLSFLSYSTNTTINTMLITNTGRVGIGTNTPDEKLDVEGSIKVGSPTTGNIRITNTSNGQSYIQFASTASGGEGGILNFARWGTTDATMTINTFSDRVGINTTNPLYDLDIVGTSRISSLLVSSITTLQPQITITTINLSTIGNVSITGNLTVNNTIYSASLSSNTISSGIVNIGNYLSTNTINMTNGQISALDVINTNRLSSNTISSGIGLFGNYLSTNLLSMNNGQVIGLSTINGYPWTPLDDALWSISGNDIYNDNTGNVGIGTSTPSAKLTVVGSGLFGSTTNGVIRITNQFDTSYIQSAVSTTTGSGNSLRFTNYNAASTTMTINTSTQRVGINTTNPQYDLDVSGNIVGTNIGLSVYTSSVGLLQYVPLAWMVDGIATREPMFYTGNGIYKNFLFPNVDNQYLIGPRLSTIIYDGIGGGGVVTASYANPSYTDWILVTTGVTDSGSSYSLYSF